MQLGNDPFVQFLLNTIARRSDIVDKDVNVLPAEAKDYI